SGRAHLLAHLDQPFGIEPQSPTRRQNGRKGSDVDRMLALVVDHAATVIAVVDLRERPRRKTRIPTVFQATDDVAMAVAKHGRETFALHALGIEKRAARLLVRENAAAETERLERRLHLLLDIARELAGPFRVLTFGRDRDPARQIGLERAAVEVALGARDGVFSGHGNILVSGWQVMPRPERQ